MDAWRRSQLVDDGRGVSDAERRLNDIYSVMANAWQKDEAAFGEALGALRSAVSEVSGVYEAFYDFAIDDVLVQCVHMGDPFRTPALEILSAVLGVVLCKKKDCERLMRELDDIVRFMDVPNLELAFRCMIELARRGPEYMKVMKPHVLVGWIVSIVLEDVPIGAKNAAVELVSMFDDFSIADENVRKGLEIVARDDLLDAGHRLLFLAFLLDNVEGIAKCVDASMVMGLIYQELSADNDEEKVIALRCFSILLSKASLIEFDYQKIFDMVRPEKVELSVKVFDVLKKVAAYQQAEMLLTGGIMNLILHVMNESFPLKIRIACVKCFGEIVRQVPQSDVPRLFSGNNMVEILIQGLEYQDAELLNELFEIFDVILHNAAHGEHWFLEKFKECDGWQSIDDLRLGDDIHLANHATSFYHRYQTDDDALIALIDAESSD